MFVTREALYNALHARLPDAARRLSSFERDALAQAAAQEAAADVGELPFQVRPGLVAEILRFYDQVRRQSQQTKRFEELITEALGGADNLDRGAERLLRQTRFLARAFRAYERRVAESGACDEHALRDRLIGESSETGLRHVVVTIPDWIADPAGLFVADFDLLTRLPGLRTLDIISTTSVLQSGFHERIHNWWPGLEEIEGTALLPGAMPVRPSLFRPEASASESEPLWFTHRDRQNELQAVADRLLAERNLLSPWEDVAVVFKRPLPYLYLAPDTLGAAGIDYRAYDALPLAAEPAIAAVDLVLDCLQTDFSRDALVALLRAPQLIFRAGDDIPSRQSIAAFNRTLSDARYLGGLTRLEMLAASRSADGCRQAFEAARVVAVELSTLLERAPASVLLASLLAFLERHWRPPSADDPLAAREADVRQRLVDILQALTDAHRAHHDPLWTIDDMAAAVRRWIGDETFDARTAESGVHLLDDQAARYGDFADITVVGLVETDWPDRPRRNIFYPPGLLKALNWPSEKDRSAAADARFLDLLTSPSTRLELSTFMLDDEAIVARSVQLDEVPTAGLSIVTRSRKTADSSPTRGSQWDDLRRDRSLAAGPEFHGSVGPRPLRPWSVSAIESYIGCPFKFFSQHVLKLEEEPDDEEVLDPRRQGQLVHEVFEEFFKQWQAAGHREISSADLPAARDLFIAVVNCRLEAMPDSDAGLERTRLLGSAAAAGLGEAVFRMEAERPVPVIERLLEHSLEGTFEIQTEEGPRQVALRGKVDRIDLLADGTFRLIDYKLGWPPDRNRALQLPIYGLCAEQRLRGRHGRTWTLGEAVYLAFKGPKRVVPLFSASSSRDEILAKAQQRLANALDGITRGEFPPSPDDVFRCDSCAFTAVCRKDYVGDV